MSRQIPLGKRFHFPTSLGLLTFIGLMIGCISILPPTTHIYESRGVMYRNPAFSPDGNFILVESKPDLLLFQPDGSLIANLTEGAGVNYGSRWSPDGRWIIFVSDRGGQTDICRIRPEKIKDNDFANLTKTAEKDEDNPGTNCGVRSCLLIFSQGQNSQAVGSVLVFQHFLSLRTICEMWPGWRLRCSPISRCV